MPSIQISTDPESKMILQRLEKVLDSALASTAITKIVLWLCEVFHTKSISTEFKISLPTLNFLKKESSSRRTTVEELDQLWWSLKMKNLPNKPKPITITKTVKGDISNFSIAMIHLCKRFVNYELSFKN